MTKDKTRFFTPPHILELVQKIGPIILDPCADPEAVVPAARAIMLPSMAAQIDATPDELKEAGIVVGDGLALSWGEVLGWGSVREGVVFVNPPYGRAHNAAWAERVRGYAQLIGGPTEHAIALVPASVGSDWFRDYWAANAICFVTGRVQFLGIDPEDSENKGRFDSALVYFGGAPALFEHVFGGIGKVVRL